MLTSTEDFESLFTESLKRTHFVKLTLGHYQGTEEQLKNIYVREVRLKGELKLTFTYRYKTRDIVKNYPRKTGVDLVRSYLREGFKSATLFTIKQDVVWTLKRDGRILLREENPSMKEIPNLSHDKQKKRIIEASVDKQYLHALGILDRSGVVYKNAQDKYKQINHFVSLLKPLIAELPRPNLKRVVDMGSGKGYLTFALYDYMRNILQQDRLEMYGVEFRKDLVDFCNQIARDVAFNTLHFVEGSIIDYPVQELDMLIALHACDTATDDAIYKGIRAGAQLIVVAPCCHKQIRRQMEKSKMDNEVEVLTRFGVFLERQAEMLTDGLRALILEYFGYKTKVFEFISDVHTPKNVLIAGVKSTQELTVQRREHIITQIRQAKSYFGIRKHYLEELLGL